MADLLRAAVIGTGFVGPFHIDAIRRAGLAEVIAIAGSDPGRTRTRAVAMGVERATTDLDELFADPAIDVLHICTPNATHVDLARRALEAGKHVVVEKPLAPTTREADALVALARERMRHAAVAFTYRGYPMVQRARSLVGDGQTGPLRLVHGTYLQDWLSSETDYNWRLEPTAGRSRAVADIGSHWFDTAEFISGLRIEAVCADFATFLPTRFRPMTEAPAFEAGAGETMPTQIDTEDAAAVLVRFTDGARGTMLVSQVSPGRKNAFTIELNGSLSSLAWAQEQPERLWVGTRGEERTLVRQLERVTAGTPSLPAGHPEGWAEALRDLMRAFYGAITEGVDPASVGARYPTVADGARAVRLVEAVADSARSSSWVTV